MCSATIKPKFNYFQQSSKASLRGRERQHFALDGMHVDYKREPQVTISVCQKFNFINSCGPPVVIPMTVLPIPFLLQQLLLFYATVIKFLCADFS